ncbi:class I SAM-dependent methyltransferase, partial [Streptomyces sp. SID10116]|nr:class I SAM-dependent methyltransferase [Streptomyces sp. SID10116]
MLDYSQEADRYDASRGGEPRAAAAAEAVLGLLPAGTATLLDVACGTGLVTRRLAAHEGLRVTGVDAAYRMVRLASERVPGAIVLGDCRQLPFPDGSFDAVATVWLLHLLSGPDET